MNTADRRIAEVERYIHELAIAADTGAPPPTASVPPTGQRPGAASAGGGSPASLLQREWMPLAMVGSFALAGLLVFANNRITVFALGLWLLGLTILVASPLWRAIEKIAGVAAFVSVPAIAASVVGWPDVRWSGFAPDVFGPALPERFVPATFGFGPAIDGLLIARGGLLTLVMVGVWLLYRGSARARR